MNFGALPIDEFAELISLPAGTLRQLRRDGKGPDTFRLGRRVFVHESAAKRWLAERAGETYPQLKSVEA